MNNSKEEESRLYKQSYHAKRLKEEKLDQALADTFPASDPLPWTSNVSKTGSERNAERDPEAENEPKSKTKRQS